jgi:hypothetical protein
MLASRSAALTGRNAPPAAVGATRRLLCAKILQHRRARPSTMPRVPRPPTIGDVLPRADEVHGIETKLAAYCLNLDHEVGGPKALGFLQILGIKLDDADYLAEELRAGVRVARISDVRDNGPFGILCEVRVPVRGLRDRSDRIVAVTTSWELRDADDRPRLVTAYIDG